MSKKAPIPEMRCPTCGTIKGMRLTGGSKGVEKFYCPKCCIEVHVQPSRGIIEVFEIDLCGDLLIVKTIILL